MSAIPYSTEAEHRDDLFSLAATPQGMAALFSALGVLPGPTPLTPGAVWARKEVPYADPEATTGHPRQTDLEMCDGQVEVAVEDKYCSSPDSAQLAAHDRVLPAHKQIILLSAVAATWSSWDTGKRVIRAVSWDQLATGLRKWPLDEAHAVADRMDASVAALDTVVTEPATPLGDILGACDAGTPDTPGGYHVSNGRLQAVLARAIARAGIGHPGPDLDCTRGNMHPPLIGEWVSLGEGVSVGVEIQGHRRAGWLTGVLVGIYVSRDGAFAPSRRQLQGDSSLINDYVAERTSTLSAAAVHFAGGQPLERLTTLIGNLHPGLRYDYGLCRPDPELAAATKITSYLAGRPSERTAGVEFRLGGTTTFADLVDLIGQIHHTLGQVKAVEVPDLQRGVRVVVPDWNPDWLPGRPCGWSPGPRQGTGAAPGSRGAHGRRRGPC